MSDRWKLEQSEFENHMYASGCDVWLDNDTFDVYLEAGSGYLHTSLREYIPVGYVIKMLEHAGYKVTK